MRRAPHPVRGIHADHDHFAMRKIDHAHDAEDDGEPERDQRINKADQQAADENIEIKAGHGRGL